MRLKDRFWNWCGHEPQPAEPPLKQFQVPIRLVGLKGDQRVVDALDRTTSITVRARNLDEATGHVWTLIESTRGCTFQ